jgi:choline dehydrogenase-like flavoprotein
MTRTIETDICIIGAGITAAMVAEKLADERDARILVLEAGDSPRPLAERARLRQRYLAYGENPWPGSHTRGQTVTGRPHGFSPSMVVGGLAMHWGAVTPRFTPEDFRIRSLYGLGDDWPIDYADLDRAYQEAEERMGVAGDPGPSDLDARSGEYPMPALPLTYNLVRLKEWGESAGIPLWPMPSAKNSTAYRGRAACCRNETCWPICPVGAKYSPEFTFDALEADGRLEITRRTLVRRLRLEEGSDRIASVEAIDLDRPEAPVVVRARTFVLAAGYVWSPHLLLLSADSRFPDGLANGSGLVGKYLAGHRGVNAFVELPFELYPGMNGQHSLMSQKFMRQGRQERFVRHDFRIWESAVGRGPRLRNDDGGLQLGDEILAEWRGRALGGGTARVRAYYETLPARDSELTLDAAATNPWGDPLPRVQFRDSPESAALREHTEETITALFDEVARAGDGRVLSARPLETQDHPGGGCRMGGDVATSVVDSHGRSHDHENLFVVGAPTFVTAGCTNGTLTMAALGIRAAEEIGREFSARPTDG